jgi:hypothetical protein
MNRIGLRTYGLNEYVAGTDWKRLRLMLFYVGVCERRPSTTTSVRSGKELEFTFAILTFDCCYCVIVLVLATNSSCIKAENKNDSFQTENDIQYFAAHVAYSKR